MKIELSIEDGKIQVSDGYHTFDELYEHRVILYIALCNKIRYDNKVIKSKLHYDGSEYEGRFIMQAYTEDGKQISYHLPNRLRDACKCDERHKADERDGHTSDDVVKRLLSI